MKELYSLKELREMREETRKAASEIIEKVMRDGKWHTAHELSLATNGLVGSAHFSRTLASTGNVYEVGKVRFKVERRSIPVIRKMAELDDNNNIIRIFDQKVGEVNTYRIVRY